MERYTNAYQQEGLCFKRSPPYSSMPNRRIITNIPDEEVCNNSIKTSKYTVFDFIPLNLLIQFSRLPNIYFLVVGIMQMVPMISSSGGFPAIFIPLSIVVAVSGVKDFYEDVKRKQSDEAINSQETEILEKDGYRKVCWRDIRIGDVVRVKQNEQFPADLILLQSQEDKYSCYIETKNLDGETNLKMKQVKYELGRTIANISPADLYAYRLEFLYERPNPFIYSFTGSWGAVPLDNSSTVLRGCVLRITKWVTGLVIYTGEDSKIMLNSNRSRQKKSRLQFKMGIVVILVFIFQLLLTFSCALVSAITSPALQHQYRVFNSFSKTLFLRWGSWILLFTNFVPISLIVSLEMVKYIQGNRMARSHFRTTAPAEVLVQTSTLNEELGQIQHLFSDKTGTLTKNYMSFKYLCLRGAVYGYDSHKSIIPQSISNVDFHDAKFMRLVDKAEGPLYELLVSFSFCHSVILEQNDQGTNKFNASSPDELAFVNMAKYCGWEFKGMNSSNQICVSIAGNQLKYKLLHTIEFNSQRKRMTVILERENRIFVYCKGADNVIYERLKAGEESTREEIQEHVEEWSRNGLRTLVFAKREIKRTDYEKWAKMYAIALSRLDRTDKEQTEKMKRQLLRKQSVGRRSSMKISLEQVGRLVIADAEEQEQLNEPPETVMNRLLNEKLTEHEKVFMERYLDKMEPQHSCSTKQLQEMLEKELELIGATAIQDQLQDNVKESIQLIRSCGVKVWMLTGDKKETAIDIGMSCGLVSADMTVLTWKQSVDQTLVERRKYGQRECCLVASGEDLLQKMNQLLLLELVNSCSAVICCRVSPQQKQDMVWLMRKHKATTLAVGDGANDVNMINTAHVGVGIKGVQGAQAALCSDYAISQFQILPELMLYHGRESYRKNAQLILFNFYKNMLLAFPQFWFGFNNHFSSATIYDPWVYQLYNVFLTSIPIVIFAVLDEQYSRDYCMAHPTLYHVGLKNTLFRPEKILKTFLVIPLFSLMISELSLSTVQWGLVHSGITFDLMGYGMAVFAQVVILSNLKILVISYSRSLGLYLGVALGILLFYASCFAAEKVFAFGDMRNLMHTQWSNPNYWAAVIIGVLLVYTIETIIKENEDEDIQHRNVQFTEIEMPLIKAS